MEALDPRLFRYIWRHSRHEQVIILTLIVLQLPFFFAALDLPKAIVNEAIQGGAFRDGHTTARFLKLVIGLPDFLGGASVSLFEGIDLPQLSYLMALSFFFLLLTLINGWFRYEINLRKGVLGERMMRRLRFDLFATLLCFHPQDIRSVKSAEVATMIKDEVEPIGGFIGDAFVQPAMLGLQALTALAFIMLQSFWLGLMAGGIVLLQAIVIPYLRKEQLRLGRQRQIASRELAGRIGEIVDAAPAVQGHGVRGYAQAEISQRLGKLFGIRVALYNRKFAVKYLNALLSQITPFFFYSIGGYLALNGSLDIGQLVAVIAAYRELPAPVKELIDWDQQAADVIIKYEQIVTQFSPAHRLPPLDTAPTALPPADAPIEIDDLKVTDGPGLTLLEGLNVRIPRPGLVALIGEEGSGRDILPRVLARQTTGHSGSIKIGSVELEKLSSENVGRLIGYVGPEPLIINASIRENVLFSLRRAIPQDKDAENDKDMREARRAGVPYWLPESDWIDYGAIGRDGPQNLDRAVIEALQLSGAADEVYRLGLDGPLDAVVNQALEARIVAARRTTRERLEASGLSSLISFFDPDAFNLNATLAENLVFGLPVGERFSSADLARDEYVRSILEAEALIEPLMEIGLKMAEFAVDMFSSLPSEGAIVERLSFIGSSDLAEYKIVLEAMRAQQGRAGLDYEWKFKLIALAMSYCEARHRLASINPDVVARILRARRSFAQFLPAAHARHIEFYKRDRVIRRAPLRENLLFGRVDDSIANAERTIAAFLADILKETGLEEQIFRIGLNTPSGVSGRLLSPGLRHAVNLARSIVKKPQILIYEAAHIGHQAYEKVEHIAAALPRTTLIVSLHEGVDAKAYDMALSFEGARLASLRQRDRATSATDMDAFSG